MESLQQIKERIRSIAGTRQITRSMRMVSTAKVQKTRAHMEANRPFLKETENIIRIAADNVSGASPYMCKGAGKDAAVVLISGDRGLCGGYNINVNRYAAELIKSLGVNVRIITVGSKARDFCLRRYKSMIARSYTGISENPFYEDVQEIADLIQEWYDSGEVGQIYMVYTRFESLLSQTPVKKCLLPISRDEIRENDVMAGKIVRCEPYDEMFLEATVPFYLSAYLLGAILESSCCEQSARVTTMDAAVKNSNDMIESLTLVYNQARQGAITQELIEIVGGVGEQ